MSTAQNYETLTLPISEEHYYQKQGSSTSDSLKESREHHSVHNAIPYALHELLNQDSKVKDLFNIYKPNRVITEGENTKSWYNTEDWAITSSEKGGKIVIGQTVSHSEGKESYGGVPLEIIQARNFEERIRRMSRDVYENVCGVYTVSVKCDRESVEQVEQRVRDNLRHGDHTEIEVVIRELERSEAKDWEKIFSALNPKNQVH